MVEEENVNCITSLSQYIEILMKKTQKLGGNNAVWFRGESSEKFKSRLVPTLYRATTFCEAEHQPDLDTLRRIYLVEQNIDAHFSQKSTTFLTSKGIKDTPWNRYFLKQHYRVKTRLLDWTGNALIALLFALSDTNKSIENDNAIVWLLSPHKLNNYSLNKFLPKEQRRELYIIPTCNKLPKKKKILIENENGSSLPMQISLTQILRKYYRIDCSDTEEMYPIAIYPHHLDERMVAQQANFTLFGNIIKGLNHNDAREKFLDYVSIDSNSKTKILYELNRIGINYYSAFPDLDGLGNAINFNHNLDFQNLQARDSLYYYSDNYPHRGGQENS